MKKLLSFLLPLFITACNDDVALNAGQDVINEPDYNLLAESSNSLVYDKAANKFVVSPVIYLRPFENVSSLDRVIIRFNSNHFAQYVISGDTLYNNDKKNVSYSDFSKYLISFKYLTETKGEHKVTIETSIRSITKSTDLNLVTIE